jgi:hypothetical protein
MRTGVDRVEVAHTQEMQLELDAAGRDHEGHVLDAEVLDEERVRDRADEPGLRVEDLGVGVVRDDHGRVDVGVLVGLSTRT